VQSGSALTVSSRRRATGLADQVLGALGIKSTQIDRLSAMSMQDLSLAVQTAADSSQLNVLGLGPVLDGRTLPHEPWVPAAPGLSRNVPMMIGTVKDEATSISAPNDPMLFNMDESGLRTRVSAMIGVEHFDAALAAARKVYPFASPSDTYFTLATWTIMRSNAIIQAERKLAQGSAPVHMYLLAWETPVDDGRWKVPHGLDLPLVFDNVAGSPMMLGTGGQAQRVADAMSFAWIEFARNGNPGWAPYDAEKRETMVFTASSTVVSDPESAIRQVFAKIPAKNL
jgi:para-nitrobenzyl esterase